MIKTFQADLNEYLDIGLSEFFQDRLIELRKLDLNQLISFYPYSYIVDHVANAPGLVSSLIDLQIKSSDEMNFSKLLKKLAFLIVHDIYGGIKSDFPGIDFEFSKNNIHYFVLTLPYENFMNAMDKKLSVKALKQTAVRNNETEVTNTIQPVLGVLYGVSEAKKYKNYLKVVGQNFWYLISEDKNLYTEIVEPIGYRARDHNQAFDLEKSNLTNRFTRQFIERFCHPNGAINWTSLVEFNSGNYDLDKFIP